MQCSPQPRLRRRPVGGRDVQTFYAPWLLASSEALVLGSEPRTPSMPAFARRHDHGRRIERRIFGDRRAEIGFSRPVAAEAGRTRALAFRLDLVAAKPRRASGPRVVAARIPRRRETHRSLDHQFAVAGPRETPIAIDHRAVDDHAVDCHRYAGLAGDGDHGPGLRARRHRVRQRSGAKSGEKQLTNAHSITGRLQEFRVLFSENARGKRLTRAQNHSVTLTASGPRTEGTACAQSVFRMIAR